MDKDDRTGSSVRRVALSDAGVGASVMVVSVGAGWERFADMKRAVDQPTRGKAWDCFAQIWTRSSEKDREGVFWPW